MGTSFTDFIPYILAGVTLLSFFGWFLEHQSRHKAATSPHFEVFGGTAKALGDVARKKAEAEVDAMFEEYEDKDKSP